MEACRRMPGRWSSCRRCSASVEAVQELLAHVEVQALGNLDPYVHFAVLSDFPDAAAEHMPGDDEIIQAARRESINSTGDMATAEHDRFYLFHRDRLWNPQEFRWMGWERKRGKIEEFNRLLRNAGETSFRYVAGDLSILPEVRYCITLDSDTRLPRDAARSLIGIISSPAQPSARRSSSARHRGLRHSAAARERDAWQARPDRSSRVYMPAIRASIRIRPPCRMYQDLFREGIYRGQGPVSRGLVQGHARRTRPGERAAVARPVRGAACPRRARE